MGLQHKTFSEHYALCSVPVDGHFMSHATELFALGGVHAPPEIRRLVAAAGWSTQDVDHYAFHQPSEAALEQYSASSARGPGRAYTPTRCSATRRAPRGPSRSTIA